MTQTNPLQADAVRLRAFVEKIHRGRSHRNPGETDAQHHARTVREWRRDAGNLLDSLASQPIPLQGDVDVRADDASRLIERITDLVNQIFDFASATGEAEPRFEAIRSCVSDLRLELHRVELTGDQAAAPVGDDVRAALGRAISDPGATEGFKGDRSLTEWQVDAAIRALAVLRPAPSADEIVERCAKVAENWAGGCGPGKHIATAIRKQRGSSDDR